MGGTVTGTSIAPPADWYADPIDAAAQRWWDGIGWTTYVRPLVAPVPAPDPVPVPVQAAAPWPPQQPPQHRQHADSQPQFGSLEWRDRAAAGVTPASSSAHVFRSDERLPNHEATRALISGGILVGLLVVDLVLQLPIYVRVTGIVVAIVLGLLGLRRWLTTGTGLKRSVAGLSIGALMGVLAVVGVAVLPGLQPAVGYSTALEQAIIDTSNSLQMPALAIDASCPVYAAMPPVGTVLDCTLSLDNGSLYAVTVTVSSADGTSAIVIQEPTG